MPVCPFCGVATTVPHESQQGCLDALAGEIARLRAVLERVQSTRVPRPPDDPDESLPPDLPDAPDESDGHDEGDDHENVS